VSKLPLRFPKRITLQVKLSLLVTGLLMLLVGLLSAVFSDWLAGMLESQIGDQAVHLAGTVARIPAIRQGVLDHDADSVQRLAEDIRVSTGADYVVVGDRQGRRLSHPDPEKIGKEFVGGDIDTALRGSEPYISKAVGTLGPSLRGIATVWGQEHEVIGFVAVGYLIADIESSVTEQRRRILGYVGTILGFGVFGSFIIARGLKRAIFGLEPEEIGALFQERTAIIRSIREAVVAVDGDGRLTLVNHTAREYLSLPRDEDLRGLPLQEICSCPELEHSLTHGNSLLDREIAVAGRDMIVNVVPVHPSGAVASFRPKDELDRLARELSHMQEYSELLRAQTHEYSNRLHTIAGLIQIEAFREALDFIMHEVSGHQELVRILTRAVADPVLAGLLLGKFNQAREQKIDFVIDPDSTLAELPGEMARDLLVTILGNLLDNAFDAVREQADERRQVHLSFTDLGRDLIFEVEDSGPGVAPELADTIFNKGISSKGNNSRGFGLFLARQALDRLGGDFTFSRGDLVGALFTVIIPKKGAAKHATDSYPDR